MSSRLTPDEIIRINQLYPKYGSYAAVARELGRSASSVAKYVKLAGTPRIVKHTFKEVVRK